MTKRTLIFLSIGAVVLVVGSVFASAMAKPRTAQFTLQATEAVDASLAAKAEDSCWFKVKNRSSRSSEVKQWQSVSSTGTRTEKLGDLLMVTGAMDQAVHDDHFYGCSLYQYTEGSPVVMSAITSPTPLRASSLIPFGFSPDGSKQQR